MIDYDLPLTRRLPQRRVKGLLKDQYTVSGLVARNGGLEEMYEYDTYGQVSIHEWPWGDVNHDGTAAADDATWVGTRITQNEALAAFCLLSETEGIIPALESAHAVAHVVKIAPHFPKDYSIVINLSGRGDKDCVEVARLLGKHIT